MRNRSLLPLLTALLLLPTAASAQLRFQPPPPAMRLDIRPQPPRDALRLARIADTLRREPTHWQTGVWMGVAIGATLGVVSAFGGSLGEPAATTGGRIYEGLLVAGIVGLPLAVIGGLIGDLVKK